MRRFKHWLVAGSAIVFSLAGCVTQESTGTDGTSGTGGAGQNGGSDGSGSDGSSDDSVDSDDSTDGSTDDVDLADSADVFPDSVEIAVDEVDEAAETAKSLNQAPRDGYRRTLRAAYAVVNAFQAAADRSLAIVRQVRHDVTSLDQTYVTGTLLVNGAEVPYVADFSAFDFDGDGTDDGSGNMTEFPVALRMWTDRGNGYERFLCALVSERRTSRHLGAGAMYAHPASANDAADESFQFKIEWNRTGETERWNTGFTTGIVAEGYEMSAGAQRIDAQSDGTGVISKAVRSNAVFTSSPLGFETYKFIVQYYIDGLRLALMSAESTGSDVVDANFEDVCAYLGNWADLAVEQCSALAALEFDYLPTPDGTETAFPEDFPEQPTQAPADPLDDADAEPLP